MFAYLGLPTLNLVTGTLQFTLNATSATGSSTVTARFTDGHGGTSTQAFEINVVSPSVPGGASGIGVMPATAAAETARLVTIHVPEIQVIQKNAALSFVGNRKITLENLDTTAAFIAVLSVRHGKLTPADSAEGTELTVSGTAAQINDFLASLKYQPNRNFVGADILTIDVRRYGSSSEVIQEFVSVAIDVRASLSPQLDRYSISFVKTTPDPTWAAKEGAKGVISGKVVYGGSDFEQPYAVLAVLFTNNVTSDRTTVQIASDGTFEYVYEFVDDYPDGTPGDWLKTTATLQVLGSAPQLSSATADVSGTSNKPPQASTSILLKNFAPRLQDEAGIVAALDAKRTFDVPMFEQARALYGSYNLREVYSSISDGSSPGSMERIEVQTFYGNGAAGVHLDLAHYNSQWSDSEVTEDVPEFYAADAPDQSFFDQIRFVDTGNDAVTTHPAVLLYGTDFRTPGIKVVKLSATDKDHATTICYVVYAVIPDDERLEDHIGPVSPVEDNTQFINPHEPDNLAELERVNQQYGYEFQIPFGYEPNADVYYSLDVKTKNAFQGYIKSDGSLLAPINVLDQATIRAFGTTYQSLLALRSYHTSFTYPNRSEQNREVKTWTFDSDYRATDSTAAVYSISISNSDPTIYEISDDGRLSIRPGHTASPGTIHFDVSVTLNGNPPLTDWTSGTISLTYAETVRPGITATVLDAVAVENAADDRLREAVVRISRKATVNAQAYQNPLLQAATSSTNGVLNDDGSINWSSLLSTADQAAIRQGLNIQYRVVDANGQPSQEVVINSGTVLLAEGADFVDLKIQNREDSLRERDKQIRVQIVSINGRRVDSNGFLDMTPAGVIGSAPSAISLEVATITLLDDDTATVWGSNNVDTESTGLHRETVEVGGKQVDLFDGRKSWQAPFGQEYIATYQYGYAQDSLVQFVATPVGGRTDPNGTEMLVAGILDKSVVGQTLDHGTLLRPWLGANDVAVDWSNPNPQALDGGFFGYVDALAPVVNHRIDINQQSDSKVDVGFVLMRRDGTSAWFAATPQGPSTSAVFAPPVKTAATYDPSNIIHLFDSPFVSTAVTYEFTGKFTGLTAGRYYYVASNSDPKLTGLYQAATDGVIQIKVMRVGYQAGQAPATPELKLYSDFDFTTPAGTFGNLTLGNTTAARYVLTLDVGTRYEFDDAGLLRREVDRLVNETTYEYDLGDKQVDHPLLSQITLQGGGTIRFEYPAKTSATAARSAQVEAIIDPYGRRYQIVDGVLYSPLPQEDGTNGDASQLRVKIGELIRSPGTPASSMDGAQVTTYLGSLGYKKAGVDYQRIAATGTIGRLESSTTLEQDRQARATYIRPSLTGEFNTDAKKQAAAWQYQFDRFGLIIAKAAPVTTDAGSVRDVWLWQRNDNGLVQSYKAPAGRGYISGATSSANIPAVPLDGFDVTTYPNYDEHGRLQRVDYADGTYETWSYGVFSVVTSHRDRDGNTWTYTPYADGTIQTATDPLLHTTTYTYTPAPTSINGLAAGLLETETDALDHVTKYAYYGPDDGRKNGLVRQITYGFGTDEAVIESYDYDAWGNVALHIDADGVRHRYVSDRLGQVLAEYVGPESAELLVANYSYDVAGNRVSKTTPAATDSADDLQTTRYEYDARNRLIKVTEPAVADMHGPSITKYEYTPDDLIAKVIDPLSRTTEYRYDERRQLQTVRQSVDGLVNPNGTPLSGIQETASYDYDGEGNRVSETNGLGQTTYYSYNRDGLLIQTTLPEPGVDLNDNTLPALIVITTYDGEGRKRSQTLPRPNGIEAPTTHTFYDAAGRTIREESPPVTVQVDGQDRLQAVFTAYEYGDDGSIKAVRKGTANQFDGAALQPNGTRPGDTVLTYNLTTYDAVGRIRSEEQGGLNLSAVTTTFAYYTSVAASGAPVADATAVRVEAATQSSPGLPSRITFNYYDAYGRLIRTVHPDPDGSGELVFTSDVYLYKRNGRIAEQRQEYGPEKDSGSWQKVRVRRPRSADASLRRAGHLECLRLRRRGPSRDPNGLERCSDEVHLRCDGQCDEHATRRKRPHDAGCRIASNPQPLRSQRQLEVPTRSIWR
jgi:YD repeat-containing protein